MPPKTYKDPKKPARKASIPAKKTSEPDTPPRKVKVQRLPKTHSQAKNKSDSKIIPGISKESPKKSLNSATTKVQFDKDLLKNSYEKSLLKASADALQAYCETCKKNISFQYRKNHLLSGIYWGNTPSANRKDMAIKWWS